MTVSKCIAATPAEFLRSLRAAFPGLPMAAGTTTAEVRCAGGTVVRIRWRALPARRLGALALPRLAVQYRFTHTSPQGVATFFDTVAPYFQRGGG